MAMESAWARFRRVCDYLVIGQALLALRSLFLYRPLALPMVRAGWRDGERCLSRSHHRTQQRSQRDVFLSAVRSTNPPMRTR